MKDFELVKDNLITLSFKIDKKEIPRIKDATKKHGINQSDFIRISIMRSLRDIDNETNRSATKK